MAPKLLRATAGSAWREPRQAGIPVQLPSGNIARLRPVEPQALLKQGEIIDILTPLVAKMLFQGADASAETIAQVIGDATAGDDNPAQLQEAATRLADLERVCDIVCKAAFVDPRVVDEPQAENEIAPDDIELADKVHVFTLALRGAAALRHFRYEPNADVESVPNSEGQPQPAQ